MSATEETGANVMVGSSILCCSVVQGVIKQEIIANILSELVIRETPGCTM